MNNCGILILLLASLLVTGCGQSDPVQVELRGYQRVVITPITAGEEQFQSELAATEEAHPNGDVPPAVLLAVFRDRLLPIYERSLALARTHKPRAPQVRALHAELVVYYEVAVADLRRCVEALVAEDLEALAAVQQSMVSRDADGLAGRLERLYAKHKLSVE